MKKLAILGAGSHGLMIADSALLSGWDSVVFFDDNYPKKKFAGNWKVIGSSKDLNKFFNEYDGISIAIGNNSLRVKIIKDFVKKGIPIVTICHPKSIISPFAELGQGSVVFGGAVISPFCKLDIGCILNTSATLDHESILAEGVHISAGAHLGGLVNVGPRTFFGLGSSTISEVSIGSDVIVGGGAVVIKDVPDGLTVVGVPAKPLIKS